MRPSTSQPDGRRYRGRLAIVAALAAMAAAVALPASASAASCPVTPGVFATAWIGGSGNLGSENWTNGTPTGSCDVTIASPGSDVITMTGGANMRSLTLGGVGSTPQLVISDQSPNTNLDAQPAGITIAAGASVTLTCQPGGCPGGGPDIYSGPSPFANAGTITVDANTGGGAVVGGVINNTGTLNFEQSGSLSGQVTNKGSITVANGATATNSGSSCGGTEPFVKNDTGGTISGTGTGTLSAINFEQGNGTSEDIVIPCGSLKYSGNGASEVRAFGGFNLTGELQSNQALTIFAASNNTNAVLQGNITNKGQITLTCPEGGCNGGSGGGVGFNVNDKDFVNAGTFTVAAASGTGGGIGANPEGTIVNTGTMQFDQNAYLGGPVTNKGKINIATGKTATSSGSSCGDTGGFVKNDTGGSINGTGSGFLSVLNYEQGNGTTSGTLPVQIPCGSLKYTGTGASTVLANASMTGNLATGQTLRIAGQVSSGAFASAGTIVLDPTGTLNSSQLVNTGTLKGTGTVAGSVENTSGTVSPGASPGKLTLNGNYTQGAGGRLEIEIAGTATEQFDALAVGGSANLNGTVALIPVDGYQDAAAVGDIVAFLTYGGSLTGGFATTSVNPSLPCPKQLTVSNDAGAKALKAVVGDGASCGGDGGGGGGGGTVTPPPPVVTPPAAPPAKKTCPKGKQLKKGKCVAKKCPKGKKLKKGRCVKKKQPKARSRQR